MAYKRALSFESLNVNVTKILKFASSLLVLLAIFLITISNFRDNRNFAEIDLNSSDDKSYYKNEFNKKEDGVVRQVLVYRNDPACSTQKFSKRIYRKGSFPIVALVSYPGSGNTWTRHLIELATGIYTGSHYKDIELLSKGFLGECEDWYSGSTIVQKTHLEYNKSLNVSSAILLIRNPLDAVVSFVKYLEAGHLGHVSTQKFNRKEWPKYMLGQTYHWISLIKSWILSPIPVLIIYYEDLTINTNAELEKICRFLKNECQNLNSACFQNQKEGNFHRKEKFATKKAQLPEWATIKLRDGIMYLNGLLLKNKFRATSYL